MQIHNGKPVYNSSDLKAAIARRHKNDMFFCEVKDGPTQVVRHHSKIDALGIKISWTDFTITGYEVKVARSDFLRDDKWPSYLPMCNRLYFAVAPGVCTVEEIPENCGLVQITPNGGLRTVKKAPWRDIEMPVNMLLYLMFTYIGPYWQTDNKLPRGERLLPNEKLDIYRQYLEDKVEFKTLGYDLSKKIRERVFKAEHERDRLKRLFDEDRKTGEQLRQIALALEISGYHRDIAFECLRVIEELKQRRGLSPAEVALFKQINAVTGKILDGLERPNEEG